MLEEVRITALGVIEDAVLEFSSGFTVVTGETGAGKTMVVTGLGLMFGARPHPRRVGPAAGPTRRGCGRARTGPRSRGDCGSSRTGMSRSRCSRPAASLTTTAAP